MWTSGWPDVKAVQTLSRLNRVCPGKEDCFVLDFVDGREIRKAFQQYYEDTMVSEATDPNQLHDLQRKMEDARVYLPEEVEDFAQYFSSRREDVVSDAHGALNRVLTRQWIGSPARGGEAGGVSWLAGCFVQALRVPVANYAVQRRAVGKAVCLWPQS